MRGALLGKNLVFSSVGKTATAPANHWLATPTQRNFDLVIVYYEVPAVPLTANASEGIFVAVHPGTKFENFLWYWSDKRALLQSYDAVFVADDDLILDTDALNRLFQCFRSHNLSLAQPALDDASLLSWRLTRKVASCSLRFTNFVECGLAVFSREALERCLPSFALSRTGAGLDLAWSTVLGFPRSAIAVIDEVTATHPVRERAIVRFGGSPELQVEGQKALSLLGGSAPRVYRHVFSHATPFARARTLLASYWHRFCDYLHYRRYSGRPWKAAEWLRNQKHRLLR